MKEKRERRLNNEFRKNIYEILKYEIKNPEITEMFTVMEVDVTQDLKYADVIISVYSASEEKKQKTLNAITESAGAVRKILSGKMHIRTVPELRFKEDTSYAYGQHIDELLEKINEKNK
ncbi:MAG TPA: 30S ribosome-binding factor RbfA [Clostridiales bacterium]|nr:30S ribosome-binding factor RbfA [Clostridiales bacterium]